MNEVDAKDWLVSTFGDKALAKLERFHGVLFGEVANQNLISPSTLPNIWARHFVDSAQLIQYPAPQPQRWFDIGSGAGFPGLIVALLTDASVVLSEPRRLRAQFLQRCIEHFDLSDRVTVEPRKAQNIAGHRPQVISARAVARLDAIFLATRHLTQAETMFILPKGESASSELAIAQRSWHGVFHVKPSMVDARSGIVIATGVSPR